MTDTERAYIAGIIDGEGSIMLTKFHNNQYPAPCISISSTTIELLQWIKEKTKMGTIKSKKNYNKINHKYSYTYTVKYDDAIELLRQIQPYLIIETKKKRAELILSKYKEVTPRNGRYNEEMKANNERVYEEFISIKQKILHISMVNFFLWWMRGVTINPLASTIEYYLALITSSY